MVATLAAENEQRFLLASSFGYGFTTRFENLVGRNKAGKALFNPDAGASILPPVPVNDPATDWVVAVTTAGHLLAFPLKELPELDKGKGNKLIQIPPAKLKSGEEVVTALAVVHQGGEATLFCGARKLTLGWRDLQAYEGARASRGQMLPRGFQKVDRIESA
jgi:topoisomerase-4 subunit A